MLHKKFQPLPAQEMPDSLILRKLIDDILRIDHNGCKKSHFIPRLSDFRKCGKRILRSTLWDTERKRAVTLHMCPNKLQEIHHYRVAKSFACFPCHPLNGNRRKFFRYDLLNDSIPTAFQMLQCGQRLRRDFFFNFGLFCTGCILSQIVKLPSVFPSRRTGQHTNCMKSAVRFLHRKCDFVLLDIDLERFIFQRYLISVKKEFLSLICQLTGTICRKASIFCQREKQTGRFGQLKDMLHLRSVRNHFRICVIGLRQFVCRSLLCWCRNFGCHF